MAECRASSISAHSHAVSGRSEEVTGVDDVARGASTSGAPSSIMHDPSQQTPRHDGCRAGAGGPCPASFGQSSCGSSSRARISPPAPRRPRRSRPGRRRSGPDRRVVLPEHIRAPFDLSAGPLHRFCLLRLGPDVHLLSVVIHPIVSDGWSMGLVHEQIAAFYVSEQADVSAPGALPVPRRAAAGDRRRERLCRPARPLGGVVDRAARTRPARRPAPPAEQTFRGASLMAPLPVELLAAVRATAGA